MKRFFLFPASMPSRLKPAALAALLLITGCDRAQHLEEYQKISALSVSAAAIKPNGIVFGTLENGAYAHLSDTTQPNFLWRQPSNNQQSISHVAIAKGASIAITTSGSTLTVWDTTTGKSLHYLSAPAPINAIAINHKASRAILGLSNHTASIINLNRGGVLQTLPHSSPVVAVAIQGDDMYLTGEEANLAHLWQAGTNTPLHSQQHNDAVTYIQFNPTATMAISASRYDAIKGWDLKQPFTTRYQLSSKAMAMKAGRRVIDLAFTDPLHFIAIFSDNTIEHRSMQSQQALKKWHVGKKTILAKENTRPVSVGEFKKQWRVLMSDGKLYTIDTI
jgi:WD40 repeat protein